MSAGVLCVVDRTDVRRGASRESAARGPAPVFRTSARNAAFPNLGRSPARDFATRLGGLPPPFGFVLTNFDANSDVDCHAPR
ncbi:hypothetical protein GCM10010182_06700 [Actinomadura cremea]|nr:hypothetical protein GCM10010182_06700 [Actinomadura cremea]